MIPFDPRSIPPIPASEGAPPGLPSFPADLLPPGMGPQAAPEPPEKPPATPAVAQPSDEELEDIARNVRNNLTRMLHYRRQWDQQRAVWYQQYLGVRPAAKFPDKVTSRSNVAIPYPFAVVEETVSQVMEAFFGFWPWFETIGRTQRDTAAADAMQSVLLSQLPRSNFLDQFELLVRNICIFGQAAMKVDWDWDYDVITVSEPIPLVGLDGQPVIDPATGQPVAQGERRVPRRVPRNRPVFTAIDVYDFVADPDGKIVAHMTERDWGTMKREFEQNPNLYFPDQFQKLADALKDEPNADEIIIRMAEVWDTISNTVTLITVRDDTDALGWKDFLHSFRAASYAAFKRRVYGGDGIVLFHGPNPFWHMRAPIVWTSYIKLPNQIYGLGAIEAAQTVYEAINRTANMIIDNWNLGINRRYVYDVDAQIDEDALDFANVPGGRVGVHGDVTKAILPLPSFTPSQGDYMILPLFQKMVQLATGFRDTEQPSPKQPVGMQLVMVDASPRFKKFLRNLEVDIIQPLLQMCASMNQQFLTEPYEIIITGEEAAIPRYPHVTPAQLVGGFEFKIFAANYLQNKVVRQRNLMALMNIVGNSPYINQYEALREVGRLFEIRNLDRILYTPEQVAQMQAAAEQAKLQRLEAIFREKAQAEIYAKTGKEPTDDGGGGGGGGGGGKGGRPPSIQFEGTIPGSSEEVVNRMLGQQFGASALGLAGLGKVAKEVGGNEV